MIMGPFWGGILSREMDDKGIRIDPLIDSDLYSAGSLTSIKSPFFDDNRDFNSSTETVFMGGSS
jgi:hypothetical protein